MVQDSHKKAEDNPRLSTINALVLLILVTCRLFYFYSFMMKHKA